MDIDVETETHLRALHLSGTVLELNPEEETFFKSETGIQDTEELRRHIIEVQEDAYKVGRCCADRMKSTRAITSRCVFRSTRIPAFVGLGSRGSRSPGCLHIHAPLNWGKTGQMRYLWTLDAAVRISLFSEFASITE
jgi:hypothetical protein